jgi:hypothetical protein
MTAHRALNWAIAALIALCMAASYQLDGPDDIATAQAVAEDLQDAQSSATKTVAAPALSTGSNGKTTLIAVSMSARADK